PAPGPGIDVENLVLSISEIKLELNFSHSIESNAFQEPSPVGFHDGLARRLNKCAGITELYRILPSALGHKRSIGLPVFEYSTEGKLILTASRNTLLDENLISRNVPAHLRESS